MTEGNATTSFTSMNDSSQSNLLLGPGDESQARLPKVKQIWDPTAGCYRDQKLPLALSKTSLSPVSPDGRPTTPQSPPSSVSSHTSASFSLRSYSSTATSLSIKGAPAWRSSHSLSRARPFQPPPGLPARIFQILPLSIYENIIQQLKLIHERSSLQSCQTCYMRDLCTLSLTSRTWDKVAVKRLYERIQIVGHDSKEKKKQKNKTGGRLQLLRRTLRGRMFLAQLVKDLKVPSLYADGDEFPKEMIDLVASVVMACPNLERLDGFYPIYSHEYDRLTHALSTRRKLKEHIWLIGENAAITQRSQTQLPPGLMDAGQKASFLFFHNAWSALTTLFLYSPERGVLEKDIFINFHSNNANNKDPRRAVGPGILHRLPSLRHLCIAGFDLDDFDDMTLQHLPPLLSLRLQDLEGVTFWGLSEFARSSAAFAIRSLSLVNLDILYISAIASLLLHMKNLKRFTLVQDTSPETAEGEVVFQPVIASSWIEYIHWDIPVPGSANENLAQAIRAGGFPRLRTIRAPSDYDGRIQALCRPRACVVQPSDWSGRASLKHGPPTGGLRAARRAAQQRIEDAWSTVQFKIIVEEAVSASSPTSMSASNHNSNTNNGDANSNGSTTMTIQPHEIFDINGFMGTIGSKIDYCLDSDIPGSDFALIDFADIVSNKEDVSASAAAAAAAAAASATAIANADSTHTSGSSTPTAAGSHLPDDVAAAFGAAGAGGEVVCQGGWNARYHRGPKWWSHAPRPRYRGVDLMKFF